MGKDYEIVISQEFDSLDEAIEQAKVYGKSWDNVKVCKRKGKFPTPIWFKVSELDIGCCCFEYFRYLVNDNIENWEKEAYIWNTYTGYNYFKNPARVNIEHDTIEFVVKGEVEGDGRHTFVVDKYVIIEMKDRFTFTISEFGGILFSISFQ